MIAVVEDVVEAAEGEGEGVAMVVAVLVEAPAVAVLVKMPHAEQDTEKKNEFKTRRTTTMVRPAH